MVRLLFRAGAHRDECPVSYFIRIAQHNGFKHIGHLFRHAGLNWKNNRVPVNGMLTGEFALEPYLSRLELPAFIPQTYAYWGTFRPVTDTNVVFAKSPKICPVCVVEREYCSHLWSLVPMLACGRHKCMLVDTHPVCAKKLSWYRSDLKCFDDLPQVMPADKQAATVEALQLSEHVEHLIGGAPLLSGSTSIPAVLEGLKLNEFFTLLNFITHYQQRLNGRSFSPISASNMLLAEQYSITWKTFQQWPESIYKLLEGYIDKPMALKGERGLRKHFRDFYDGLYRQRNNLGIGRLKKEFEQFMQSRWPGILDQNRITRIQLVSAKRNIISQKEVSHILGSRPERIDKLVQQGRITQVVFKGKAHYFREQVESLASEISSNLTMAEACELLEITRYQLKQLLDAGVISALQKPNSLNRDWVINKVECLALINVLLNNARKHEAPSDALSMGAIQRRGYSIVHLILAMQSGELQYSVASKVDRKTSLKQFTDFTLTN